MISQHLGKEITEEKRARWVELLQQSAIEAGLPNDPEFGSVFGSYIVWGSRLAVENSTIGACPPEHMPMPHWDWETAAGPPGSRVSAVSALAVEAEGDPPVALPAADVQLSFAAHIKALFRRHDRQSMTFAFDLWSYEDVRAHSTEILQRLKAGSMPCDGAWPPEQIQVFQRWVETEMPCELDGQRKSSPVKILVICRPKPGVDPKTQIAPLAPEEMAALRKLRDVGLLADTFSPGGPGAVLIVDGSWEEVDSALQTLPLVREELVDTEVIELHPFPTPRMTLPSE